ncbi:lipopolysaccharide kinase InaA family protein [Natronospora cellulosivora (SeqCode)]
MLKMSLEEERYNSKITLYYMPDADKTFSKGIIDYFFRNKTYMRSEEIELIQRSKTKGIEVYKVKYMGEECFLKKYSYKRIEKMLQNNLLRKPEGIRNIKNSNHLLEADIFTADPIFSATRRNFISYDSIFFMKKADGIELKEYLKNCELSQNENVLRSLGEMWGKFIGNNFIHQDPELHNFFIDKSKSMIKITLIDIDDIYLLPFFSLNFSLHSVARFLAITCKNLYRFDKKILELEDLMVFMNEVIDNCDINLDLQKVIIKLEKLIIKKIYERNYEYLIPHSKFLSDISIKYK